jgi:hypothetical protein
MRGRLLCCFALLAAGAAGRAFAQEAEEEALYEEAYEEEEGYLYEDEEVIRAALEETLSQPEFARLRAEPAPDEEPESFATPQWLDRFIQWLAHLLGGGDETGEEPSGFAFNLPGARLILYGMALLILAAALFFIARSVLAISRDKRTSEEEAAARVFGPESAPGELAPDEYWRRALSYGEKRQFKEGLRELLLGSMSVLERKGLIRFRRGLTNRDYFYSARGGARESFGVIASSFEHVYFGRREATSEAFRDSCRAYQKSFQESLS